MAATETVEQAPDRGKYRRLARCTNRRYLGTHESSRRVMTVAGGTFRCCPGCAMRYGWVVADYVRDGLEALPAGTWVAFLTLTEGSIPRSVETHAESCSRFLGDLWRFLQKTNGGLAKDAQPLPYIGVREWQARGAVHTHLLIAGWSRVDFEDLRALVVKHGFGARFNVKTYRVAGDGSAGDVKHLSAYMAKTFGTYLTKSARALELWKHVVDNLPPGYRLVVHSKSWRPNETLLSYGVRRKSESIARRVELSPVSSALRDMRARIDEKETAIRAVLQATGVPITDGQNVWYDEPNDANLALVLGISPTATYVDAGKLPTLLDLADRAQTKLRHTGIEQMELSPYVPYSPGVCRGTRLRIVAELGPCPSLTHTRCGCPLASKDPPPLEE